MVINYLKWRHSNLNTINNKPILLFVLQKKEDEGSSNLVPPPKSYNKATTLLSLEPQNVTPTRREEEKRAPTTANPPSPSGKHHAATPRIQIAKKTQHRQSCTNPHKHSDRTTLISGNYNEPPTLPRSHVAIAHGHGSRILRLGRIIPVYVISFGSMFIYYDDVCFYFQFWFGG